MTMESGSDKKPLLGMTIEELQTVVAELKMPKFTASQIAQWLYEKRVTGIESMTNLSKQNREKLSQLYTVGRKSPAGEARSKDGTAKYLFEVAGGKWWKAYIFPTTTAATSVPRFACRRRRAARWDAVSA